MVICRICSLLDAANAGSVSKRSSIRPTTEVAPVIEAPFDARIMFNTTRLSRIQLLQNTHPLLECNNYSFNVWSPTMYERSTQIHLLSVEKNIETTSRPPEVSGSNIALFILFSLVNFISTNISPKPTEYDDFVSIASTMFTHITVECAAFHDIIITLMAQVVWFIAKLAGQSRWPFTPGFGRGMYYCMYDCLPQYG